MRSFFYLPLALMLALSACDGGNVESASHAHGPKPPRLHNLYYEPNGAYGSVRAIWAPPVYNREGTIVKPTDSRNDTGREDYEHSLGQAGKQAIRSVQKFSESRDLACPKLPVYRAVP